MAFKTSLYRQKPLRNPRFFDALYGDLERGARSSVGSSRILGQLLIHAPRFIADTDTISPMPPIPDPPPPEVGPTVSAIQPLAYESPTTRRRRAIMPLNADQRARRSLIWGSFFFVTPIPALLALWYGIGAPRVTSKVERSRTRMVIGGISLGLLGLALWAGLFCLSTIRARHLARDVTCASNLRQISLALINYAMSNRAALPDGLDVLVRARYISTSKVFVCPNGTIAPPAAPTTQASGGSYVYLGKGLKLQDFSSNKVPILIDVEPHGDDGFNAAYGDGSVRKINAAEWRDILQQRLSAATRPSY
jgi:hypothetical protein